MPIIDEQVLDNSEWKLTTFDETPILPTYIVAFIVGEFEYVERKTSNNIPIRVYTPLGLQNRGVIAADFGVKCVDFYEKFFGIKYPLPKLDMIGIQDYPLGGMENWGLITYAMNCLIYDTESDSVTTWQYLLAIVAHEIAHMWFGNYVTIEWWSHLWLKEGFATFLQYYCCDQLDPSMKAWDVFHLMRYTNAQHLDSLASSHPIHVDVGHPREAAAVFDQISYAKGASLIRMIFHWVGEENFRKGTSNYLKQRAYTSAETIHLWEALEEAVNDKNYPVKEVGQQWTKLMNFPILKAELITPTKLKLTQSCCQNSNQIWKVPVIMTINGQFNKILMTQPTQEIDVPENAVININKDASSFLRTNYSSELLHRLLNSELSAMDQRYLQSDVFYLATSGHDGKIADWLDLVFDWYYKNAFLDTAVLSEIMRNISALNPIIAELGCSDAWNDKKLMFYIKFFEQVGWSSDNDTVDKQALRSELISNLISCGHQQIIQTGVDKFHSGDYSPKMGYCIYKAYLYANPEKHVDELIKLYGETDLAEAAKRENIRNAVFSKIGCDQLRPKIADFMFSNQISKSERGKYLAALGRCAGSNYRAYFRDTFLARFLQITEEYQETQFLYSRAIDGNVKLAYKQEDLNEFLSIIKDNNIKPGAKAIAQAKEGAERNIRILETQGESIKNALSIQEAMV